LQQNIRRYKTIFLKTDITNRNLVQRLKKDNNLTTHYNTW